MYAMWRTVVFTLAALRAVKALQEVLPFSFDPSAISNIELLIPLSVPRVETREVDGEDSTEDHQVDRDEQYSAIPEFILDTDSFPGSDHAVQTSTNFSCSPQPELTPHRSWYSNNVHQRELNTRTKKHIRSEEPVDGEKMEILRACKPLAAQAQTHASPEARKVLLLLCSELVEYLRARCDCCEKKRRKKKPRSRE